MRGLFITFEGIDGAGKTTQQHLAAQALREQGYDVLESREPGGTQLAEKVRALVLDPELPLTTATQTLLYLAARSEHVDKLLLAEAVGKICGEQVSFYPPGIPVLLPGELVTEEIIAYCRAQKELGLPVSGPADSSLQTIRVIAD